MKRVASLAVLPCVGALLVAWWLIGDLSETGGEDRLLAVPGTGDAAVVAGLVGVVLLGADAALLIVGGAGYRWRGPVGAARVAGATAALGVWAAFVLRVLSSKTVGANIGGGALMLVGPVVAVALVAFAAAAYRRTTPAAPRDLL